MNETAHDARQFRRKYLEQELLEVSAVGIPANPEALQLGLKAGAIEKADLQELLELLRTLCEPKASSCALHPSAPGGARTAPTHILCNNQEAPNIQAGAAGVRSHEAQLLQLARALRDALKR